MKSKEILQQVAAAHNLIVQVTVSGDNTIPIADAIRILRDLAQKLQNTVRDEESKAGIREESKGSEKDVGEAMTYG